MKKSLNILIVDSSRLFQSMLANLAQQHGFTAFICNNGKAALKLIQNQHIDIVCASYHLEDIDGSTLCQQLRESLNNPNMRIILFTSEDNKILLKQALLAGATDIYNKHQIAQFELYLQRIAQNMHTHIIGQILLIEDSPSQLLWLESLLNEHGLEVDAFNNAEEALIAFDNNDYDLVITDIVLGGNMSGLSLVREIRRLPGDKGLTPIFAVSAYNENSRRLELYHVGVNDYMTKPIMRQELIYRLTNLIQSHRIFNELTAEREHLKQIALLDAVTGLYNRNAFNQFVPRELAIAKRHNTPLSIAVLDIDYFKRVNDKYGHDTGDKVLADIGLWLRNTVRKGDIVFRWGGEEFVILLVNCHPDNALIALEKKQQRFNKHTYAGLSITVSIGISGVVEFDKEITLNQLFQEADTAVYNAKTSGRNKVCLYKQAND